MYLSRLEIQGFKTFAKKTVIAFPAPKAHEHALTVIVGPNGSGKSNIADAIRWCLGEQSMKHLRGKKAEDIIFSGSEGKSRSGFAEVAITLNNDTNNIGLDFSEVTITRRLYRDGDSEYLVNGKPARLSDIQLMLAQAGIGQRTYTVVAQGMIDHVLTSSPEERKVFFDDATGVRGLQMKRHQSLLKLKNATKNLIEVEMLVGEIEPRLRILKRQVKRLEERESLERELAQLQTAYYGTLWWDLQDQLAHTKGSIDSLAARIKEKRVQLAAGDEKIEQMEALASKSVDDQTGLKNAQRAYKEAQRLLGEARRRHFEAERDLELARVAAQSTWAPLPLAKIIAELDEILHLEETAGIHAFLKLVRHLRDRLTRPNPTDFTPDPALVRAIEHAALDMKAAETGVKEAETAIDQETKAQNTVNTELFDVQRELRAIQSALHTLESEENRIRIDSARIETRIEGLFAEMKEEIGDTKDIITAERPQTFDSYPDQSRQKILKIKHQLELIGGIDEETVREYEETQQRYTFLTTQADDLRDAIDATEKIIDELDERIRKQSEKAFKAINEEFQKYFKVLFGGGSCSLVKLREEEMEGADTKVALDRPLEEMAEEKVMEDISGSDELMGRFKKRRDNVAGIDIQATPPGKKLKALNLLSGGERALTSIALLSAIMATNPSPFVVLDEVDAALDESNTMRFANILNELRKLSQFIVVTHNRATMERADLLYGVTMGNDGISNLLSVTMSDIEEAGTARR